MNENSNRGFEQQNRNGFWKKRHRRWNAWGSVEQHLENLKDVVKDLEEVDDPALKPDINSLKYEIHVAERAGIFCCCHLAEHLMKVAFTLGENKAIKAIKDDGIGRMWMANLAHRVFELSEIFWVPINADINEDAFIEAEKEWGSMAEN